MLYNQGQNVKPWKQVNISEFIKTRVSNTCSKTCCNWGNHFSSAAPVLFYFRFYLTSILVASKLQLSDDDYFFVLSITDVISCYESETTFE